MKNTLHKWIIIHTLYTYVHINVIYVHILSPRDWGSGCFLASLLPVFTIEETCQLNFLFLTNYTAQLHIKTFITSFYRGTRPREGGGVNQYVGYKWGGLGKGHILYILWLLRVYLITQILNLIFPLFSLLSPLFSIMTSLHTLLVPPPPWKLGEHNLFYIRPADNLHE